MRIWLELDIMMTMAMPIKMVIILTMVVQIPIKFHTLTRLRLGQ